MAKGLIISRGAFKDLDRIIEFNNVRNQSKVYSSKIVKKLYGQFIKIKLNPSLGLKTLRNNVYVLIRDDFYIYYKFISTVEPVYIINIFHQKENV